MIRFFAMGTSTNSLYKFTSNESLLLSEFAHRAVNDFSCASAALRLARRRTSGSDQCELLDRLASRLEALGAIQRLMQPPARGQPMDLAEQMQSLCQAMVIARYADRNIELHLSADDMVLEAERGWRILMIVRELLVNAARHAFDEDGGTVLVEMFGRPDEIVCKVHDDGCGWSASAPMRPGYGSTVVRMLVREIGGDLKTIPAPVGTSIVLKVPRPIAPPRAAVGLSGSL